MMKAIFKLMVCIVAASSTACCQAVEENLVGMWYLNTNYEFPDLIIFRPDHQYFVYNSNSVSTESLGLREDLKSDDICIDGAYTSMTEKGTWSYNQPTKVLILKERNILEKSTDFCDSYGKSRELKFHVKQITQDKIKLCFDDQGILYCDEYERIWRTNDGKEIPYREITKEYAGTGNQTEEILLTGYETELKLSYEFYKNPGKLVVEDRNGKVLFSTEIARTNERTIQEIPLRGVTKLILKVVSSEGTCNWKIKVEIK
jgi:hypothetical protein